MVYVRRTWNSLLRKMGFTSGGRRRTGTKKPSPWDGVCLRRSGQMRRTCPKPSHPYLAKGQRDGLQAGIRAWGGFPIPQRVCAGIAPASPVSPRHDSAAPATGRYAVVNGAIIARAPEVV